jgi:thymidylate synthase
MKVIKARNAHQALPEMMWQVANSEDFTKSDSRNGPVVKCVTPLTIHYLKPLERVVFWPERDANPFFHLFESLWMLAGRNDVAYVAKFSSNIAQFSDDGVTFHGAYGHRWRNHFGFDQITHAAEKLRANPDDRRVVLQMWDALGAGDGLGKGKDYPCNMIITLQRDGHGRLDMVVYNRSNDILWGALGANCVHMSVMQEYVAAMIGCEVGQYWQVSSNMHAYTELTPLLQKCLPLGERVNHPYKGITDPYEIEHYGRELYQPFPLVSTPIESWDRDLHAFLDTGTAALGYRDPFFRRVALPMLKAYEAFSQKDNPHRFADAYAALSDMADCDWKLACTEWILRRRDAAAAKAALQKPAEAA